MIVLRVCCDKNMIHERRVPGKICILTYILLYIDISNINIELTVGDDDLKPRSVLRDRIRCIIFPKTQFLKAEKAYYTHPTHA